MKNAYFALGLSALLLVLTLGLIKSPAMSSEVLATNHPSGAIIAQSGQPAQQTQPAQQSISPRELRRLNAPDVANRLYEQLPDLPREDSYVYQEGGDAATRSTLLSRLIAYHTEVMRRPTAYRFDWKLTLADYLGANEIMVRSRYPGADVLSTNPIDNDRAVIADLSRSQRDELVRVLVETYNPNFAALRNPSEAAEETTAPPPVVMPRPGAADLLR
jgi:hypothetical protein